MNKTTEEQQQDAEISTKLKQIRSINEKIDLIETKLEQLVKIDQTRNSMISVDICSEGNQYEFILPTDQIMKHHELIRKYYTDLRALLIQEAQTLMK